MSDSLDRMDLPPWPEQPLPYLYSRAEWAAMSDAARGAVREFRRREVEAARVEHEARRRLLDDLTAERFGHGGE
jgi:hypothetical protein